MSCSVILPAWAGEIAEADAADAGPLLPAIARPGLDEPDARMKAYLYLGRRIHSRTATLEDADLFREIIQSEKQLDKILSALDRLRREPTDELHDLLYLQFIRADSHPDVLHQYLRHSFATFLKPGDENPDRASLLYAWPMADAASAALYAFNATGEHRFIDLIFDQFDRIADRIDARTGKIDETRGRVVASWGFHNAGRWMTVITHAARIGFPVVSLCDVIAGDPELSARHGERAAGCLKTIEAAMAEFDADFRTIDLDGARVGYYWRHAMDDVEPLNHMHAVAATLVMLHKATGKAEYRERAELIARYFRAAVTREENGSWTWGYHPTPENMKKLLPERIWKGEVTMMFPVVAHRMGRIFSAEDMQALAATFRRNVHRGGDRFNSRIGRDEGQPLEPFPGGENKVVRLLGWMILDFVDPDIRDILQNAVASRHDLFPNGWLSNPKSAEMYAYRMKPRRE